MIDCKTPKHLTLHLIVDNYATHGHPDMQAWLAKHPRFVMHFTPTGAFNAPLLQLNSYHNYTIAAGVSTHLGETAMPTPSPRISRIAIPPRGSAVLNNAAAINRGHSSALDPHATTPGHLMLPRPIPKHPIWRFGNQRKCKPIEAIEVGDVVLAWDAEREALVECRVKRLFRHKRRAVLDIHFRASEFECDRITATSEHPFWIKGKGWVAANDLLIGDVLKSIDDRSEFRVVSVDNRNSQREVFNFEVDGIHNYFIGDDGVLVHNASSHTNGDWESLPGKSGIEVELTPVRLGWLVRHYLDLNGYQNMLGRSLVLNVPEEFTPHLQDILDRKGLDSDLRNIGKISLDEVHPTVIGSSLIRIHPGRYERMPLLLREDISPTAREILSRLEAYQDGDALELTHPVHNPRQTLGGALTDLDDLIGLFSDASHAHASRPHIRIPSVEHFDSFAPYVQMQLSLESSDLTVQCHAMNVRTVLEAVASGDVDVIYNDGITTYKSTEGKGLVRRIAKNRMEARYISRANARTNLLGFIGGVANPIDLYQDLAACLRRERVAFSEIKRSPKREILDEDLWYLRRDPVAAKYISPVLESLPRIFVSGVP